MNKSVTCGFHSFLVPGVSLLALVTFTDKAVRVRGNLNDYVERAAARVNVQRRNLAKNVCLGCRNNATSQ
jgi:hypothetical protein